MLQVLLTKPQAMMLKRLARQEINRIFNNCGVAAYTDGSAYGSSVAPNLKYCINRIDDAIQKAKNGKGE